MLFNVLLLLTFLQIVFGNLADVTFKNVHFRGYRTFTPKFKPLILWGNSLKNYIPDKDFDTIEFIDQNIPVLYEGSITDIKELKELLIENSNVQEIRPGAFKNVSNLNKISLRANKIERIENGVFNKLPIQYLDLSNNQISTIYSKAFDDMQHIYLINLSNNYISKYDPNWFKHTPELTMIVMKNNLIKELLDHSFVNLESNKYLNLIFSNNKLSKIEPKTFVDLKKINQLALNNNLLEKFDKEILKDVTVNDLRLNNNSIQCFDVNGFDTIFKGQSVYIEFNPFDCECISKMQKWAKNNNNKYLGINDIKCEDDESIIINIEDVDLYKKINDHITLILPKNSKLK